jgi:hypothetical protein
MFIPAREAMFELVRSNRLFRETFVASLYGHRTVGLQGVPPGGGISILSYGELYELALRWGRIRGVLSERGNCH